MKLATSKSLPQEYNRGFIARLLQKIDDQVNNLTDGKVNAVTNSYTAAPTGGTHAVGDFVRNTNTVEIGTAPYNYVILGWICTVAGTPGTFTEVRADASGAISVGGPGSSTDNAVARWNGTGGNSIQNSVVLIGDTGDITGVTTMSMSGQLTSTLVTGTSPLVVASTTKVANLNADLLDDQSGAYYLDSANFTGTNWTDLTDGGATTLHAHADITGNAGTVTVSNEATDTTCFPLFATAASGSLEPKTNANMTFNSSTGVVTFASAVLTTADINGGTVDGASVGASSASTGAFTTLKASTNLAIAENTRLYLDGVAASGDTYVISPSSNVLDLYAGGAKTLSLNATAAAVTGNATVSGKSLFGASSISGWTKHEFNNTHTSDGSSSVAVGLYIAGTITSASGDTTYIAQLNAISGGVVTAGAGEAHSVIATARFAEPVITLTGADTATVASTVYIANAPTEGGTNAALYSASGNNILAGNTRVGGTTAPTEALHVTGTFATSGIGAIGTTTSSTTALNLPASTTGVSSIRLAHGSAPSSPVNGDMWTTTAGLYVRINGVTVGPLT